MSSPSHAALHITLSQKRNWNGDGNPYPSGMAAHGGYCGITLGCSLSAEHPEWGAYGQAVTFDTELAHSLTLPTLSRTVEAMRAIDRRLQAEERRHGPPSHFGWLAVRLGRAVGAVGYCYPDLDGFEESLDGLERKAWSALHDLAHGLRKARGCGEFALGAA